MEELEKEIKSKIDIVSNQYDLEKWDKERYGEHPYKRELDKLKKMLFSSNIKKRQDAIKGLNSLLLSLRAWEDGYYDAFWDTSDKYKDKFVDGFNNWDEWYDFLKSIVEDAKEYCKLKDKKE